MLALYYLLQLSKHGNVEMYLLLLLVTVVVIEKWKLLYCECEIWKKYKRTNVSLVYIISIAAHLYWYSKQQQLQHIPSKTKQNKKRKKRRTKPMHSFFEVIITIKRWMRLCGKWEYIILCFVHISVFRHCIWKGKWQKIKGNNER